MRNDIASCGCAQEGGADSDLVRPKAHRCHFDNVARSGRCPYTRLTDEQFGSGDGVVLLKVGGHYGC